MTEDFVAKKIAALEPGWDLAAMVIDGWASGLMGEAGKTLRLVAKDLRENRDKVIDSYVRGVGVFHDAPELWAEIMARSPNCAIWYGDGICPCERQMESK